MTVYYILLTILGSCVVFKCYTLKHSTSMYLDIIAILLLIILSTLRSETVGTDTGRYLKEFNNATNAGYYEEGQIENGFHYLLYCLRLITDNQMLFLFVISLLTLVPLCIVIHKISTNISLSLFLYVVLGFYTQSYNVIRQSIAMPFILLAIYYLSQNSLRKSIICFIIATQFHLSAMLLIIIYALNYIKMNYIVVQTSVFASFVVGIVVVSNAELFDQIVNNIIMILDGTLLGKYTYISDVVVSYGNLNGMITSTLPLSVLAIYTYKVMPENIYTKTFVVGVVFNNILSSHGILLRYPYYFTIISILIFPILFSKAKCSRDKIILGTSIILMTFLFVYSGHNQCLSSYKSLQPNAFPYRFIFEH